MADIIATVSDPYGSETESGVTVTAAATSIAPNTIENMLDVDLQTLTDGALLIYKNNTAKWTASTMLDKQNMEGGEF
jgi:hypothetical protein